MPFAQSANRGANALNTIENAAFVTEEEEVAILR